MLTLERILNFLIMVYLTSVYFRDLTTRRHLFIETPFVQVHLVLIATWLYLFAKVYFIKLLVRRGDNRILNTKGFAVW